MPSIDRQIKTDGEPPGRRSTLSLAWQLGSPFLSRRRRRARSHGLGFRRCRRARRRGLGRLRRRRTRRRGLGRLRRRRARRHGLGRLRRRRARRRGLDFRQRFAMLGHGSVSFHCTSSALGSFVTKASRLETGLLISS